jgi:Tol biopolymer transport system component
LSARSWFGALAVFALVLPSFAQRDPVLKQIAEPHPYYFREMYLPQLTTGPSAVAWSPDSKTLACSKAGTLWLQKVGTTTAEQLTDGPGYDYQPDWSSDGRWLVYAKYWKDAVELWAIDLETHQAHQLTTSGAVNVEPRFSPDGSRITFVSTSFNGRFHIFSGRFENGLLQNVQRLTGENRSPLPRYYYSPFDMEISPVWSPDGKEILFVSNRGHIYGTGGFWRMKAEPGAEPREIHYEETTWKARPDFSPDGKRLVFASYTGRAWHQLWLMPAEGGDPFPISYGDFDNIDPRWSPDGKRIAFISNRGGNTSLWTETIPGGVQEQVITKDRHYLRAVGRMRITVVDESGQPTSARLFITAPDGRAFAPDDAWMRADDSFVRSERSFEPHYFHTTGVSELTVPAGNATVGAMKGLEYRFEQQTVEVKANQTAELRIKLHRLQVPEGADSHWVSGDVHVHMNYGGAYRDTPLHLVEQAAAENLSITQDLVVNKEQRIPDIAYFRTTPDPASTATNLLLHGQEFHTSYWGHLGLLHLTQNFLLPDYSGYPGTAAASLYPTNANVADMAHEQGGVVGYVHPFDSYPDPLKDEPLTDELPVDVALGKVDYIEVLGFSDHKSTARVWYQLLNCGFRLPTAAGTDAMANFASLRGPVGLNRVYVQVPKGPLQIDPWLRNLKQGRTFATNGPLLGFSLGGKDLGDELQLPKGGREVPFKAWVRSIVPLDHVEIICDGQVAKELKLTGTRDSGDFEGTLPVANTGWCLLRAWSEQSEYPILDLYPYATTSPIYVQVSGSKAPAKQDAAYFMAWIDRLARAVQEYPDWNNDAEKLVVMDQLSRARAVYEGLAK